jgi:hypothetical protein
MSSGIRAEDKPMSLYRKQDLERGMELIPQIPEIMPDEADERIRPIYEDVQRTLRVPFVNFIFRTLANYPDYFEAAWSHLSPVLRTRVFEQAADELRARALLEPIPNASDVEWEALGDMEQIRPFSDSIHYVLPKLLLIATAWDEDVLDVKPEERHRSGTTGDLQGAEIPLGVAEGTRKAPMMDPKQATGELRALFEAIKKKHAHPGVATYYRALGNWPAFLRAAWDRIEPHVGSDAYEERKRVLINHVQAAVHALPSVMVDRPIRERGVAPEKMEEIKAILTVFRFKLIPDLLLDVALIEAMLDGPEAARRSRFSGAAVA